MKAFFKNVLATVVGIFVFIIISGIFFMISIIGMVSSQSSQTTVSKNSVLVLNLSGTISERTTEDFMSELTGSQLQSLGLNDILNAIKKAKNNENIKGIYIEAGALLSSDFAALQEIRNALEDFKSSKKWIVAYADAYTQPTYYVSSVADKVYLNPIGELDWHGLASQGMYVKDMLAKFGVKMQVPKVGKYKSATEMFTETKMSEADREQTTAYINGIWNTMCDAVSKSRKISKDSLNAYADRIITFDASQKFIDYKMVDGLKYANEMKAEVKKMLKIESDDKISQVSISQMKDVSDDSNKGDDQIAVYYAWGDIVQSEATGSLMGSDHSIVSGKVCEDMEKFMNDDDVKAVVIRINSGGGDAYASEQIWHYINELNKKKPVVVSMGGMAASGAYYMSAASRWIVADPTTLTGSIGIFGMFPDVSGLLTEKLGVKFDEVKTNANSAFGAMGRPMTEAEMAILTKYINRGYELFRKRVADGRKLGVEKVEEIAQGRVWLGSDALKVKLVDQLGGLDVAIAKAASLANTKDYHTTDYPATTDWMESLFSNLEKSGDNYLNDQMHLMLGDLYEPFMLLKNINQHSAIQARMPYVINVMY